MNEITVFNNDEFGSIRTVTIEHEPWFVLKDGIRFIERVIAGEDWQSD